MYQTLVEAIQITWEQTKKTGMCGVMCTHGDTRRLMSNGWNEKWVCGWMATSGSRE